jgi:proton glutamate symport protein
MKNTSRLLFALFLALGLGVYASYIGNSFLQQLAGYVEPVGTIWIGFLKMVVIPLLISLLVTSVASKDTQTQTSPILKRTLLVFGGLYVFMQVAGMLIVPFLIQLLPPSFTLSGIETDAVSVVSEKPLSFIDQLMAWVPENPFKSAAEGAILPVVVFALFLGLALNHVAEVPRTTVLNFFSGIGDAMLKIVEWLLLFAPLGIFCIVFPLAIRAGSDLVGVLGMYVFLHLILYTFCIIILYLLASTLGKTSLLKFIKACLQPQFIALGTQSSIATLPTMVTSAEQNLGLPAKVTDTVLPLAVSVFKVGTAVTYALYALFVARLYHIEFSVLQWLTLFIVSLATAISATGLPSGAAFFAPILTISTALGLPIQVMPVLFAMDTIPDMGVTAVNVTGDMAAVTIVGKESLSQQQSEVEDKAPLQELAEGDLNN